MTGPIALLLDVDTGIDDSLALLYAAASPDVELVAVTCVARVARHHQNDASAFSSLTSRQP
jgi:inosine-uridine nucleoside N-ribohydrolase